MKDQVILITGALTGIGRATAIAAAREGYKVVVSGRNPQTGAALVDELRALGADADFIQADIRRESEVQNLVDGAVARFGGLDVAVNNAGAEGQPGPITAQTPESYAATFDTNVLGVVLALKHEARVMVAQGGGGIVNVSSTFGHEGAANASIVRRQQTRGRGHHQVRGARIGGLRRARERRSARADRDGDAQSLHRERGEQGAARIGCAVGESWTARGNRPRDPLPRLRRRIVCHRQILSADGGKTAG